MKTLAELGYTTCEHPRRIIYPMGYYLNGFPKYKMKCADCGASFDVTSVWSGGSLWARRESCSCPKGIDKMKCEICKGKGTIIILKSPKTMLTVQDWKILSKEDLSKPLIDKIEIICPKCRGA